VEVVPGSVATWEIFIGGDGTETAVGTSTDVAGKQPTFSSMLAPVDPSELLLFGVGTALKLSAFGLDKREVGARKPCTISSSGKLSKLDMLATLIRWIAWGTTGIEDRRL
jgi:hypothetical protein